jgi:uncharacterized protein YdiU (UPF0061 family)
MNRVNPKYVLRNHLAQAAIERAVDGDNSEVAALMRLLSRPYDEQPDMERYAAASRRTAPSGNQLLVLRLPTWKPRYRKNSWWRK